MKNNTEKQQFELEEEGFVTFAKYKLENATLYINHVEAPVELRGKGSAGTLMQYIAEYAKNNSYKIVPICGYASVWLKRHSEYNNLIA